MEYAQYHTRYTELSAADFLKNQNEKLYDDWKGFGCNMFTTPLESIDVSGVSEKAVLYEKTETYYRKTIELAQERNIPIVVVISPFAGISEAAQQLFNTAGDIASAYNVPFLNSNLVVSEIGLDYSTDAADTDHLNYKGNQKFSKYIGKYLIEHFNISDRRGDDRYLSWQRSADFTEQMIADQELVESTDLSSISKKLHDEEYWVIVSVDGTCNTSDEYIQSFLKQQGIVNEGASGIWLKKENAVVWSSGVEDAEFYTRTAPHDFLFKRSINEEGQYINRIIIDNIEYKKVANGINVLVYDTRTEKIADFFGINADDAYSVLK